MQSVISKDRIDAAKQHAKRLEWFKEEVERGNEEKQEE
jgi:hypothetical protein